MFGDISYIFLIPVTLVFLLHGKQKLKLINGIKCDQHYLFIISTQPQTPPRKCS